MYEPQSEGEPQTAPHTDIAFDNVLPPQPRSNHRTVKGILHRVERPYLGIALTDDELAVYVDNCDECQLAYTPVGNPAANRKRKTMENHPKVQWQGGEHTSDQSDTTDNRQDQENADTAYARRYYYKVSWSAWDNTFVATVVEFSSLSCVESDQIDALRGIVTLVAEIVADLRATGSPVPKPISEQRLAAE